MGMEQHLESLAERARITISFEETGPHTDRRQAGSLLEEVANRAAERAVQLYADKHPRPSQVNQRQAAEMLGVAPRTVRRYIHAGLIKLNGCGLLPIEAIDTIRAAK